MKKFIVIASSLTLLLGMSACVSSGKTVTEEPAPTPTPVAEAKVLDEAVGPNSGNKLADTIGPVTVVWKENVANISRPALKGASVQVVEYLGKKCIKVTPNFNNEIRIAFEPASPVELTDLRNISFSVAGFEGGEGSYNCGIFYTDKDAAEYKGSFYLSNISPSEWTEVSANLVSDEKWGNNFSPKKKMICVQFWSNSSKPLYIADLALTK